MDKKAKLLTIVKNRYEHYDSSIISMNRSDARRGAGEYNIILLSPQ